MEPYTVLPDRPLADAGPYAKIFLGLGIERFSQACRYVHELPYGYNSDRDDPMTLFAENKGSCTTKHAVIALLGGELGLAIDKHVGVYPMTEALVTGTGPILERHRLPYVPMIHCFLVSGGRRVDLSEGNKNGKNGPIDDFLYIEKVAPDIAEKEEYLLYRKALKEHVLPRQEFRQVEMKTVLKAREEGILLLKANLKT